MTKKSIITWLGVVSALITILLVFENPFQDKAKLVGYIEEQSIIENVKKQKYIDQIKKIKVRMNINLSLNL